MNYHVEIMDMPVSVKAAVIPNEDDSYTIFINSKFNYEQQQKSFEHELKHIINYDFERDNVDDLEYHSHCI